MHSCVSRPRVYRYDILTLSRLYRLTGVLEVGLFCSMASAAFFGQEDGTVLVRYADGVRVFLVYSSDYATMANNYVFVSHQRQETIDTVPGIDDDVTVA